MTLFKELLGGMAGLIVLAIVGAAAWWTFVTFGTLWGIVILVVAILAFVFLLPWTRF